MEQTKAVKCPFCGAPYRDVIAADVVQVKCKYCGGVFQVPLALGVDVPRCVNHPQKVAVGICNDCGQRFCASCLHAYRLVTQGESATLYLCEDCLRARYAEKIQVYVYMGALFILVSLPFMFALPIVGAVFLVPGALSLIYGLLNRPNEVQESNVEDLKSRQEEKVAELAKQDGVDYEAIYDDLVARYMSHWGASLGIQLLDDEINACMRHGQSFPEAVTAVYRRQKRAKQSNPQRSTP